MHGHTIRLAATTQILCVAAVLLLIAVDAAISWVVPVLALFLAAVLLGERTDDHEAVDRQIEALDDDGAAPDLRIAVALAVVLYAAVLSGVGVALAADTCSALVLPFAVAVCAFGALRLHVAVVLARG